MMQFLSEHSVVILSACLALSELLALIPSVKANSVFQLVVGMIQKAVLPAPKA